MTTDSIGINDSAIETLNSAEKLLLYCQKANSHQRDGRSTAPAMASNIRTAIGYAEAIVHPWS